MRHTTTQHQSLPTAKHLPRVPLQVFHVEGLVGPGNQDLQFGLAEHLQPLRVDDLPQASNERLRLRLNNNTNDNGRVHRRLA